MLLWLRGSLYMDPFARECCSDLAMTDLNHALDVACSLAQEAGTIILSHWGNSSHRQKADGSPVTDADLASEKYILKALGRTFPDHGLVGEEGTVDPALVGGRRTYWVVDPLDGTRNFTRGFPCFATSIALVRDGQPLVGVIREHMTGRLYSAVAGCGAHVDGKPLRVNENPLDRDFFVGVPSVKSDESPATIERLLTRVNVRNIGSTAVHLALVASGAIDAAYALRCYAWDVAAGLLMIQEAGGLCSTPEGKPCLPLIADEQPMSTTPVLAAGREGHPTLLDLIASAPAS